MRNRPLTAQDTFKTLTFMGKKKKKKKKMVVIGLVKNMKICS